MSLFVVGIVFHVVVVDSSILCSWWWLPLCSFFALGGSAKYLEVGLNPQKEVKRAHLQLKGNGVPDTFNMSFFKKGGDGHTTTKKSARYLQVGLHMQNQFCVYHCREDIHPSQ